jgi:hypothetical protein
LGGCEKITNEGFLKILKGLSYIPLLEEISFNFGNVLLTKSKF